ncbi:hypothetical protein GG344DRAFT_78926 [Lentinula edodes]|nr:hypothetical protein GG344DRAFT_78926 [Lentinula edodes]
MRFLTTLLPLITLALRVAATGPSPGSNSIPLTNIGHPEPVHPYGNVDFADEGARQQPPCRNCLEKAKDIVATSIQAPVDQLKVVVGSSLEVIKKKAALSVLISIGCVTVGIITIAIFCIPAQKGSEWCREFLDGSNKSRRDSGYPTCQRLECGADVCGVPKTSLTSGGHPKRDLARTLYRRRLEGLDDEDKNE